MSSRLLRLQSGWLSLLSRFAGNPIVWLVWLLPVFAWAPLTYPGYFEFHSGFLPVFNLNDLAHHLADPAWAPTIGQAYDLWRGERGLPYLLALMPRAFGAASAAAVKWIFGAGIVLGAVGIYGWTRRRLGDWPGLVAAAVYAFWPLGLATIYVRGAFAEAVFLGLLPWVLWAADAAGDGRPSAAIGLGVVLAAAFWTQAGLALWLAGLVLVYLVVTVAGTWSLHRNQGSAARGLLSCAGWPAGLALAALGLLPLILRRGLAGGAWVNFADHFVYPHQLLLAGWGVGPSIPGPYDTLTFQLGLVACGLAAVGMADGGRQMADGKSQMANGRWQITEDHASRPTPHVLRTTQYLSLAFVLLLSFLSTTLSASLWKLLPFLSRTLTYPWQLLLLTGPWLAWLAGLGGRRLLDLLSAGFTVKPAQRETPAPDEARLSPAPVVLVAALIALALLGSYDYLRPLTTNAPVPEAPLAIFGDNQIALLSAVTAGPPGPAGQVTALVRWQALRPLDLDYTVFFHIVGPDGKRWGQQDTMPQGNRFPTSQWRPGQVVMDQYQATIAVDAPISDDYRYFLGLYQWQTGQRLTTRTDDKVVLTP